MKRFISILLILALALAIFPLSVFAENYDDWLFRLGEDGESYVVRSYVGWNEATVTVPSTYNGLPVKGIGHSAFSSKTDVETIILPDSIEFFDEYAFYNATSLKNINFPEKLLEIRAFAFQGTALTSLVLPDSVVSVSEYAFMNTPLETVTFGDSLYYIGFYAFANCQKLKTISFGEGHELIDFNAFSGCSSLESVSFPDSIIEIGEGAFEDCPSLKSVTFNNGLKTIGQSAFSGSALSSIVIPDSVESIGYHAFAYCENLKNVTLGKGVVDYADEFSYSPVEYTVYKNGSYLGTSDNPYHLLVSIDESVRYDEDATFEIHPNTEIIGFCAFQNCAALRNFVLPEKVRAINSNAFMGCYNLESIVLPDSLEFIGDSVFEHCTSLKAINIPASVESIGNIVFGYCTALETLTVDEDNEKYLGINGNLVDFETKTLIYGAKSGIIPSDGSVTTIGYYAYAGSPAESVIIPETVISLDGCAFGNAYNLTSLVIPDSVEVIGVYTFENCFALESITIGKSVKSIDSYSFDSCYSLKTVTVNKDNKFFKSVGNCLVEIESKMLLTAGTEFTIPDDGSVTTIGISAFYGRDDLKRVTIPKGVTEILDNAFASCENLAFVVLPDTLETIDYSAFISCESLTSITIPKSVEMIGRCAFMACNSLKKIYCEASEKPEGWDEYWNDCCEAEVVWNYKSLMKKGDIDMDGVVTTADYVFTKRQVMGTYLMAIPELESADIDIDGSITTADYVFVKRAVMGTYVING